MVKPVSPKDITADTTIEEIYEGFNEQVSHHEVGSDNYRIDKMIFCAGARAALALNTQLSLLPAVIAARKLDDCVAELDRLFDEYIEWRRQSENEEATS